ncbi:hypothetical protein C8F04DRAFT_1193353 [Mycena alexandri]|uniref:KaiA N-terminal domain-containing protein n=1 Tax=Mycena alexandri TaxID=1745969 RepID=A0AAD6WSR1_9AGAR|nr:hypothetical protein C8F04DRAFT_1193353 [Mycena alexandri]
MHMADNEPHGEPHGQITWSGLNLQQRRLNAELKSRYPILEGCTAFRPHVDTGWSYVGLPASTLVYPLSTLVYPGSRTPRSPRRKFGYVGYVKLGTTMTNIDPCSPTGVYTRSRYCAETRAFIEFLWYLQNEGTVWAMPAEPKRLAAKLPSGAVLWEELISHVAEDDFLLQFTEEIPGSKGRKSKKPVTCGCPFCRNCAAVAKALNAELGSDLIDLIPLLQDPQLRFLLIRYLSDIRGVLLGSRKV